MAEKIFGSNITAEQFLKKYWQKKPILFRKAFPNFEDPLSPDELAGIAMEEGVHARIVREKDGKKKWTLRKGPFSESLLRKMPYHGWTLLVSNLELWTDSAAEILDHFPFIPHWRCDDLMASFAPEGGSVGPHIDSYDVFLIQGMGRRRWQISTGGNQQLISGIDLKVLKSFVPEEEWVLEAGDMLYLPPGVAHYGVALENCMTYSVGFRAPSERMLAGNLLNISDAVLADSKASDELYQDPDLKLQQCPGEITQDAVDKIHRLLMPILNDPNVWTRWFGTYMSFPNPGHPPAAVPKKRMSASSISAALKKGRTVVRSDSVRLFYAKSAGGLAVFVAGQEYLADKSWLPFLKEVCKTRYADAAAVSAALAKVQVKKSAPSKGAVKESLSEWLFNKGALYFS